MKNIYIRSEDKQGEQLPDGEMQIRKLGKNGFTIKLQLPMNDPAELDAAHLYLEKVQQIMHYMSRGETVQDVGKGLTILSEMESYFTHWKHDDKLVPAEKYLRLQEQLDQMTAAQTAAAVPVAVPAVETTPEAAQVARRNRM